MVRALPVHGTFGWPWPARILAALALATIATAAIRPLRESVLRATGWALVVKSEPVAPFDMIVLSIDSDGAGTLEAADLVPAASQSESRFFKTLRVGKTLSSSAAGFLMKMQEQGRFANWRRSASRML